MPEQINLYRAQLGTDPNQPVPTDDPPPFPELDKLEKQLGYYAAVFFVLLTAMQIRQNTVITQSNDISANATLQNALNKRNALINFSLLPPGFSKLDPNKQQDIINLIEEQNQEYAAQREDVQNSLITARQSAQVLMTETSTNVNLLQQDTSENSKWLDTLNQIFSVIVDMTKR